MANSRVIRRGNHLWAAPHYFFVLVALVGNAFAQDIGSRTGTAEFQYIESIVHARAASLAGAYTSVAEGPEAVGYNAAGVGRTAYSQVAASIRYHWLGITSGNVTYAFPGSGSLKYALSGAYINYGSIEEMTEDGRATGNSIMPSSFNPSFTVAGAVSERVHVGGTIKVLQEYLGDFEESQTGLGWGVDLGLQFQPNRRNIGLGVSLLNVGTKIRSQITGGEKGGALPASLKAGMFYFLGNRAHTRLTVDVETPWHDYPLVSAALQHQFNPYLIGRVGARANYPEIRHLLLLAADQKPGEFRGGNALKLAGGFGVPFEVAELDYAFQLWQGASWVHVLAVRVPLR